MNKLLLMRVSAATVFAFVAGCVSQGKYDEAVAQTEVTRAELGRSNAELERTNAALAQIKRDAQQRAEAIGRLEALLDQTSKSSATQIASREARVAELSKLLEQARSANAAAESRAALFRTIAMRLKKQIDAGELAVVIRDGRMVLQLPNDVLFDTGRTELKPAGKDALKAVAMALATIPDRHFQVAGHTDNVPIHNDRFPSNWELSTGRALRVVHFLIAEGVKPETLSGAGYADVDPVGTNDAADGRKRNRRTEITVQPNINELVPVP
jgi:chemotaxis protein MotB